MQQVLITEHVVAYKLHPINRGALLSNEQQEQDLVCNYLLEKNPEHMATLINFRYQFQPFPS